jgi:nucleoside-diphosphate-sugar epimerase
MSPRILILGAGGRLGHAAAQAFRKAGWGVTSLVRPGSALHAPAGTLIREIDALDHAAVADVAQDNDVILHAASPILTEWSPLALRLAYSAVAAAEVTGATLVFPGNAFNYGSPLPSVIDERTPTRPSSRKGLLRVAVEERIAEAGERGTRAIILRGGDFYGCGRGSWLDLVILKQIVSGKLTYPGPLDLVHEWAYLPDFTAAMVRVVEQRHRLPAFESFGFSGHAVTGRQFTDAIIAATGQKLQVKMMSWWLIHALRPLVPLCRELSEIAYLWNEGHRIDGAKLAALIGPVPHTPLDLAVARALEDLDTAAAHRRGSNNR